MNFMGGKGGRYNDRVPEGYDVGQLQQFTPDQMKVFKQSQQNIGPDSYLSRLAGGDQETFNQMEAPAMRQFQGTLGGIASRFSGQGMGSRKSSGFQNTTTSAASNFAQELQANRHNLQRQAMQDLRGMTNDFLGQRPYERDLFKQQEEEKSPWGSLIGTGLGAAGGFFAGGPMGALKGAQLGYGIGSQF